MSKLINFGVHIYRFTYLMVWISQTKIRNKPAPIKHKIVDPISVGSGKCTPP